ncbi:unnamed protein product [Lactuca saligna]|uniref:E3 ubiquitin-protein ligase RMA n=1 Tax=Lactuca saligna TaxID=75948 RepID=A0AA36EKX7_LACSI|nr:unnamed protein product [Lactuca saligna]
MAMQTAHQTSFYTKDKSTDKDFDESKNSVSGSFECNICLDAVQEPVVTLCGHLYCWPCIYKWIQQNDTSSETPEAQNAKCPVCKTEVSQKTIVPLYGPCQTTINHGTEEKDPMMIPPRPPTPRYNPLSTRVEQLSRRGGYQRHAPPPLAMPSRGDMLMDAVVVPSPTIGMLGEMVSGRILGDLESPLFATPNSYNLVGNTTRRRRLQTTQADRSLSRIYAFLLCCIIFCLFLFT